MIGNFAIPLFALACVLMGLASFFWSRARGYDIVDGWSAQNGYRLQRAELRWFDRGPFFWTTSRGQLVYRVRIIDRDGRTRDGWVKCGGAVLGLASRRVAVRWDDETEPQVSHYT
jgi:hypothetical protein